MGKRKNSKAETPQETKPERIEVVGQDIKLRLDKHFAMWGGGLAYKTIMSSKAYEAKRLGMSTEQMANRLEELGYVKVMNTPTGARYIFSGACPWTPDEMQNWLQETEATKDILREHRKATRNKEVRHE